MSPRGVEPGVLEVVQVQPRADDGRRGERLVPACVDLAADRAARQREDDDRVPGGAVRGERRADPDLDVVGVGADGQHGLGGAGGVPAAAALGGERPDLLDGIAAPTGDEELVVGVAAQRLGVVDAREGGHHGDGDAGLAARAQAPEEPSPLMPGIWMSSQDDVERLLRDLGERRHRVVHDGGGHPTATFQDGPDELGVSTSSSTASTFT